MFYAFRIEPSLSGSVIVAIRKSPFKNLGSAIRAVDRQKMLGFVRKYGQGNPVYFKAN